MHREKMLTEKYTNLLLCTIKIICISKLYSKKKKMKRNAPKCSWQFFGW